MLHKFYLVTLIFILLYGTSNGQKVIYSDESLDFSSFDNVKIIGQDAEGFFLLQSNLSLNTNRSRVGFKTRKYKVSYFTKDLKSVWTKKIEPTTKNMGIEHVSFIKNKVLRVYASMNQGDLNLHLHWLNSKFPDKEEETKSIIFDFAKSSGFSNSHLVISKNKNLFAFVVTEFNNNNEQILHYAVLNNELKKIKQNKFNIGNKENRLVLLDIALSNKGDLLVLTDRKKRKNKDYANSSQTYQLISAPVSSINFTKQDVSIENKYIVKPSVRFDPVENTGVLVALYFNPELITESGILYSKVNIDANKFEEQKKIPLDNNLYIKLISNEYINDIRGLSDYKIHEIILRNDGGAVILAEAAYENEYSYYDYFTQSYTRRIEYYFANIFVASINADGTIDWSKVFKKSQYTRDDDGIYSSFIPMITSSEILMLLNTDMNKNNEVLAFGLNNEGLDYEKLIIDSDQHIILLPSAGKQISASSIVIPVLLKRKLALAKFEF